MQKTQNKRPAQIGLTDQLEMQDLLCPKSSVTYLHQETVNWFKKQSSENVELVNI